jgi:hypothetical protein
MPNNLWISNFLLTAALLLSCDLRADTILYADRIVVGFHIKSSRLDSDGQKLIKRMINQADALCDKRYKTAARVYIVTPRIEAQASGLTETRINSAVTAVAGSWIAPENIIVDSVGPEEFSVRFTKALSGSVADKIGLELTCTPS